MKHIFKILFLVIIFGCTPSSRLVITDSDVETDSKIIQQLTNSISDNPDYFLSKLTLDTNKLAHYIDSLGFNITIESGGFKANERVYFWLNIIKQNDSVISFKASPFYWSVGGKWERKYDQIYNSNDWSKDKYGFDDKYYNFEASISPTNEISIANSKFKLSIDSLMTPYYDYVYSPAYNIVHRPNKIRFDRIILELNDKEILYLLNSINPATRIYTIKYIKCDSKREFDKEINEQVDRLIQESTMIKSQFADIVTYQDLETLIDCEK